MIRVAAVTAMIVALLTLPASAQMAHRLKGSVRSASGAPVAQARVYAEAVAGFRGEPFIGQKDFTATTNARGEWSILGLTSGVWVFEASAPGCLPQAMVLTIELASRKPISGIGGLLRWEVPFSLHAASEYESLAAAAAAAQAKRASEATSLLGGLAGGLDVTGLALAGETALVAREAGLAHALFERALQQEPHPRAMVGLAGALLMLRDYDAAAKRYWNAREVAPGSLKQALGATINDLQQVMRTR